MLILLVTVAIVTALLVTPVVGKIFVQYGIVDRPDGQRKLHHGAIPRVGGIIIVASYLAAFGAFAALHHNWMSEISRDNHQILLLVLAAAIIFFLGLWDDLFGLRASLKLAIQIAAAGMVVWAGLRVDCLFYHPMSFVVSTAFTVFWLVLCTNAFNLIDGMDGLATGIGLFASLTVLCVGLWTGSVPLVLATIPLAGALIGFLCFNFSPASVFLGDSGSYTIGFLLGCFGIIWSEKSTTVLGMAAPALAFTVPLLDVWLSVVRRFLRMKPLFEADHGHIHHKILDLGLTTRRAAMALYGLTVLCATLSLALSFGHHRYGGIVITAFCLLILGTVGALRYEELRLALVLLRPGEFCRALNSRLTFQSAKEQLRHAHGTMEQWVALRTACSDLGFCYVELEGRWGAVRSFTHADYCSHKCEICDHSCAVSACIDGETNLYLRHKLDTINSYAATIIPLVVLVQQTFSSKNTFQETTKAEGYELARVTAANAAEPSSKLPGLSLSPLGGQVLAPVPFLRRHGETKPRVCFATESRND